MRGKRVQSVLIVLFVAALGCARNNQSGSDTSLGAADTSSTDRVQQGDLRAEVERLEGKLRTLAKAEGCETATACKTAPVGERACGGPREYVVYCPATTDEPALLAAVDSLRQAEMRLNQATGAVSTCEYRLPPNPEVRGGSCVAGRP